MCPEYNLFKGIRARGNGVSLLISLLTTIQILTFLLLYVLVDGENGLIFKIRMYSGPLKGLPLEDLFLQIFPKLCYFPYEYIYMS